METHNIDKYITEHFRREFSETQLKGLKLFLSSIDLNRFLDSKLYSAIKHNKDHMVAYLMINWNVEGYIYNGHLRKQRFESAYSYNQ